MRNRNRIVICGTVFMSIVSCPHLMACVINDPPVAVNFPSPAFWPRNAWGHVDLEIGGGSSYDPDNGPPYGYDRGITWHDWDPWATSGYVTVSWYYGSTHSAVYLQFDTVGKHYVFQQVTDDDYPPATSDWEQCNVWVFDISATLSQGVIGVGDTATLTMSYSPSNLPGYEKLTLNPWSAGVIEVLDGQQTVISGADANQAWPLPSTSNPYTVTVKGVTASVIQGVLYLQFWPNGASSAPYVTYNGNSVSVTVVRVDEVVKAGTVLNGPLYVVCPNDTIQLQAKPYHSTAPWPPGKPTWEFVSQPGAATITPSSGSDIVTVTGFNVPGEYVVRAKCGIDDVGDEITIIIPPPSSGPWLRFDWDFNCPPGPGPKTFADDCGNETSVTCELTAYHFYYKPSGGTRTEVGICVWDGGINRFQYKATDPAVYGKMRFLETRHVTQNDAMGIDSDGEGCRDKWCWRVQRYDCVRQQPMDPDDPDSNGAGVWWRRQSGGPGTAHDEGEKCPGPGTQEGEHPHYPN